MRKSPIHHIRLTLACYSVLIFSSFSSIVGYLHINLLILMPFDQFRSFIGHIESLLDLSYAARSFFVSTIKYSFS